MRKPSQWFRLLFLLCAAQGLAAQNVFINGTQVQPGGHAVPDGALVYVKNNTDTNVTIHLPYQANVVLEPGDTHTYLAKINPGGASKVEGPGGLRTIEPQ